MWPLGEVDGGPTYAFERGVLSPRLPAVMAALPFTGCGFKIAHFGHLTCVLGASPPGRWSLRVDPG